ncbi:hypothetical protein DRQ53_09170 [bacterium]|nr:MAG: hypothetical protein DRQ53_09170 [bacterium]
MIVQCPDCSTRYELEASRVPAGRIRVRCARCRYVFPIEAAAAAPMAADPGITQDAWSSGAAKPSSMPPVAERLDTVATPDSRGVVSVEPVSGIEHTSIENVEAMAIDPGLDLEVERQSQARKSSGVSPAAVEEPAVATMTTEAEPAQDDENSTDRKARRLARALVSDILVYNRDKRDTALANGTLVQALGQEIKKSWELYKERVTPKVATETNYFKDALNDILAEGQKIF